MAALLRLLRRVAFLLAAGRRAVVGHQRHQAVLVTNPGPSPYTGGSGRLRDPRFA